MHVSFYKRKGGEVWRRGERKAVLRKAFYIGFRKRFHNVRFDFIRVLDRTWLMVIALHNLVTWRFFLISRVDFTLTT